MERKLKKWTRNFNMERWQKVYLNNSAMWEHFKMIKLMIMENITGLMENIIK